MAEGTWLSIGALFALLSFLQGLANTFMPYEFSRACRRVSARLYNVIFSREIVYTVEEYEDTQHNDLYAAVELHLSDLAAATARRLRLTQHSKAASLTCSLAESEGLVDVFKGSKIHWDFSTIEQTQAISFSRETVPQTRRLLHMRIHRRDRAKVMSEYIPHVISNAKALESDRRERKLYTNAKSTGWWSYRKVWESIPFQHPSTFSTLALDPILKQKIIDDLTEFKNGEQFYKEAGRAWKRGYLLYGPPGTGKSSMIACMANLLEYDVYDLELTEVRSNADLRNLLLNIGNKAIVVIEDIDCTLNLSERREKRKKDESQAQPGRGSEDKDQDENNKLTMSGLLNFIDGLWSSCVSERIFVFTTNHIEKLDAALIRSGRMDMHIHLSFCGFEAFKVLAKNYLKLKDHALFEEVRAVMEEDGVCMTPADITEVLTRERRDAEQALICLIEGLKASKINKKVQEMSEQKSRQGKESLEEDEVTEEKKQIEPAATRSDESGKKVEAEGQASENGMPSTKEELHAQVKDP